MSDARRSVGPVFMTRIVGSIELTCEPSGRRRELQCEDGAWETNMSATAFRRFLRSGKAGEYHLWQMSWGKRDRGSFEYHISPFLQHFDDRPYKGPRAIIRCVPETAPQYEKWAIMQALALGAGESVQAYEVQSWHTSSDIQLSGTRIVKARFVFPR